MPCRRFVSSSGRRVRIMASKRAMISILATFCVILGIYLAFFNHPPAAETLAINLQHHEGPVHGAGDNTGVQRPRFRHLHFGHNVDPKSSAIRALNLSETETSVDQLPQRTALLNQTTPHVSRNNVGAAIRKIEESQQILDTLIEKQEVGIDHEMKQQEQQEEDLKLESPAARELEKQPQSNAMQESIKSAGKIEAIESDSGLNAGEIAQDVADEEQKAAMSYDKFADDTKNVGRSKEYGPHHIRIFDWDGWVKAHNYIDIGTIWAYCDDPDPPPVGKVMMKKDEEWGSGVKIVIHMNSTFDENIEFGKIHLSVDVGGVHFFSKKYDACAMEAQSDFFKCPIQSGDKFFYIEQHVPVFLPMGEYYVESQLSDQFERTIVCAQVKMTL